MLAPTVVPIILAYRLKYSALSATAGGVGMPHSILPFMMLVVSPNPSFLPLAISSAVSLYLHRATRPIHKAGLAVAGSVACRGCLTTGPLRLGCSTACD